MRFRSILLCQSAAAAVCACGPPDANSSEKEGVFVPLNCADEMQASVPPDSSIGRYEPEDRIDRCNIAIAGPAPSLALPPPPKSGFRVVLPPRELLPGEEAAGCVALPYPEFRHKNVYAARVYTNGHLHHSNVAGVGHTAAGPSPYPDCNPGQDDPDSPDRATEVLSGHPPDVLFINSTQVRGSEQIAFPPGMAYRLATEGREVVAAIHWLNTTAETVTSEIAYDFFTMPGELVENELAPFTYENRSFSVPAQTKADVTTTCEIPTPGKVVSVLPHAHKRTVHFSIDLIDPQGAVQPVFEDGAFDGESDLHVFEPALDLTGFAQLRYTCTVQNDLDDTIGWGIGENEMCMIFGYMYPKEAQQVGIVYEGSTTCTVVELGAFRR